MGYFSQFIEKASVSDCDALPAPPEDLLDKVVQMSKAVKTPQQALDAFDEMSQHLSQYAPCATLYTHCGVLLEKTRQKSGMLESWIEIHEMFPDEPLPFRMMLRWYKRTSHSAGGLERLRQAAELWSDDPKKSEKLILGYDELQEFAELDVAMQDLIERHPKNDRLRFLYMKSLYGQGRIWLAREAMLKITDLSRLGPAAKALIQEIADAPISQAEFQQNDQASVVGALVNPYTNRTIEILPDRPIGRAVFFTGQLGAGGAERQMTRIAAALQKVFDDEGGRTESHIIAAPPLVCVKDAEPSRNKDFFLPVLQGAGVATHVLNEEPIPDLEILGLDGHELALFRMLPDDVQASTLQLVHLFREVDAKVAYLWQDGAVLAGALAALIAGVPRVVASFRGMPPNIRTELSRPEYEPLYRALHHVPGVSFTANSHAAATAYEEWLDMPVGAVDVIHNAVPAISAKGGPADKERWADIKVASSEAKKTVLGVFRYDHNKRPQFWIENAISFSKANRDVRFVIVGHGDEFEFCKSLIKTQHATDRVFLVGYSEYVGFWLHKADMLMHLAKYEGLPNAVIEAQLCGLPALVTPAGGTADVVVHERTGYILNDAINPDPDDVLHQLSRMLYDDTLRARWSENARSVATPKYLLERTLDLTLDLFASIGTSGGKRSETVTYA